MPFQHSYDLAKKHQLVMVKCFRRISSAKLFTPSTVSHSMDVARKEKLLWVEGLPRLLPWPQAPLTDLVTFFRPGVSDRIARLPDHLLWEQAGGGAGWGLHKNMHRFSWGGAS